MRRTIFQVRAALAAVFLSAGTAWGAADWQPSFVVLDLGSGNTYYDLNGSTANPDFGGDLGDFTPGSSTLKLSGGEGQGWATKDYDWYGDNSFVLSYRVYQQGDTPPSYSTVSLATGGWQYESDGKNYYKYDNLGANIDLLGLTSGNGTYNLDVVMSKKQYWNGGDYTSYIPGGQGQSSFPSSPYQASFTVVPEPGAIGFLGLAAVGLALARRPRRR